MRVRSELLEHANTFANILRSIVEYQTRDQAQNAVNTLSNQNLMGRLVYVREVCRAFLMSSQFAKRGHVIT